MPYNPDAVPGRKAPEAGSTFEPRADIARRFPALSARAQVMNQQRLARHLEELRTILQDARQDDPAAAQRIERSLRTAESYQATRQRAIDRHTRDAQRQDDLADRLEAQAGDLVRASEIRMLASQNRQRARRLAQGRLQPARET